MKARMWARVCTRAHATLLHTCSRHAPARVLTPGKLVRKTWHTPAFQAGKREHIGRGPASAPSACPTYRGSARAPAHQLKVARDKCGGIVMDIFGGAGGLGCVCDLQPIAHGTVAVEEARLQGACDGVMRLRARGGVHGSCAQTCL